MNRKMLLIANPGPPDDPEHYCEGVNVDVQAYLDFFCSPLGGGWYEFEIKVLKYPSCAKVRSALTELRWADYSMIVFCGHGYSNQYDETILELRKDEELPASELRGPCAKRTIILDCCRKKWAPIKEPLMESRAFELSHAKGLSLPEARRFYEEKIAAADSGLVVMYACALGEVAGDDSQKGGYYSYSLRRAALEWADQYHTCADALDVASAHTRASIYAGGLSADHQHPQIEKPRTRGTLFPFAVTR